MVVYLMVCNRWIYDYYVFNLDEPHGDGFMNVKPQNGHELMAKGILFSSIEDCGIFHKYYEH